MLTFHHNFFGEMLTKVGQKIDAPTAKHPKTLYFSK